MYAGNSAFRIGMIAMVLALLAGLVPAASAVGIAEGNSLEVRQFRIDNARIPGQSSVTQTVFAWQVTQGSWNGQALDGLSLVFVKSTNQMGGGSAANCYFSHEASLAQRQALLAAFISSQSGQAPVGPQDMQNLRLEPAVITLELEGGTVVLHVGLVG